MTRRPPNDVPADEPSDDDWWDLPWTSDPLVEAADGWCDLAGPDDDLPDPPTDPLTTPDAVLECLLELVGTERAGPPTLWLLPVDSARRVVPFVLPVAEVESADPVVAARLVGAVASLLDATAPGGAIVVGLVRAAGGDRGPFEAGWAHALRQAADERDVELYAVVAIGAARARVLEW